jgi:general L-amino acid transport system permease protein
MTEGTHTYAPSLERPPALSRGPFGWLRANLFSNWYNGLITILIVWAIIVIIPPIFSWLFTRGVTYPGDAAACKAAGGACWSFIQEKAGFILFGTFPADERWRPWLVIAIFVVLLALSCDKRLWRPRLGLIWLGGLVVIAGLMFGGFLGMSYVETANWGGLPLTLILSAVGLAASFPIAIGLALGRRSNLPAVKALCVVFIELIRGVPLISVLFMASVMVPLFLPPGITIDKLLRALIGLTLFTAAYLAEVIRGGLQAIPKGQYEAADALGLGYWQKTRLIVLPQALSISVPPMVNTAIGYFLDTSLVIIIGLFDLLGTAKGSLSDPVWRGFYRESFLFVGVIYFAFCFFMSKYSQRLERELHRGHKR